MLLLLVLLSGFLAFCRYLWIQRQKRGTPFAAQIAVGNTIRTVVEQGMRRAEVMIKGAGLGRDAALRAIRRSDILLSFVRNVTPMLHNGCRPPKKRRV
ncbi:30S ribosomal protein S11 chloroplastic [Bienertia sinuspersici]